MAKKILISKHRGAGNPKVFTLLNGSTTQVGTDLPEAMESSNDTSLGKNRVAEFEGELYCAQNYNVFKYSAASGSWGLERGGSGIANSEPHLDLGLHVALVDDKPRLYHIFTGTTTSAISVSKKESSFKGDGTWTEIVDISLPTAGSAGDSDSTWPGVVDVIQVENILYIALFYEDVLAGTDGINYIITYDMETDTVGGIFFPPVEVEAAWYTSPVSFCVHNDRLFLMAYEATVNSSLNIFRRVDVLEIVGSTMIKRDSILFNSPSTRVDAIWGGTQWSEGRHCLFSDESNLYMLWHRFDTTVDYGFRLQVYDAPANSEQLTPIDDVETTVLPNAFTQTDGNLPNFRTRWSPYTQVDGSGNSEIYFLHTAFGLDGSLGTVFKFNGSGTLLTTEGVGAGATFSMPNNRQGGGQYEWSQFKPFDSQIEDLRPSLLPGNMEVDFRIIGGSGQAVTAKLLYDVEGEHLNTFATIQVPSSGTISDGETLSNIVADSGILYTVNWQIQSDGVDVGKGFAISPLITLVIS